ncbi:MAG: cytidine/deoxycytidylate deaminase family protein [Candidatus Micrarchaeota archaeon]
MSEAQPYVRPSWDEYFMEIAKTVASRGTCDRGRSGAVLVRNHRILSTGYVGSPPGLSHCDDAGHLMKTAYDEKGGTHQHCVRTTHAEINAMIQAARHGVSIERATLYCKMEPCLDCAKALITAGVERVVCEKKYHGAHLTRDFFKEAGVKLEVLHDELEEYPEQ